MSDKVLVAALTTIRKNAKTAKSRELVRATLRDMLEDDTESAESQCAFVNKSGEQCTTHVASVGHAMCSVHRRSKTTPVQRAAKNTIRAPSIPISHSEHDPRRVVYRIGTIVFIVNASAEVYAVEKANGSIRKSFTADEIKVLTEHRLHYRH